MDFTTMSKITITVDGKTIECAEGGEIEMETLGFSRIKEEALFEFTEKLSELVSQYFDLPAGVYELQFEIK